MSTMDEDASTTDSLGSLTRVNDDDSLGSVDPDVDPGTEPLVDSSPGTIAPAAAAADVEVVSAPNGEGTRDPLKHLFRRKK